ncbi:MAG: copper resistance D family protein [Trueperaceae bacterium]
MDSVIKACLYIGTVLFIGAGAYRFFVVRSSPSRILQISILFGFALLLLGSVASLAQTVTNVLGRFDPTFIWRYANATQHGSMTFLRLGLAVMLLLLFLMSRWHNLRGVLFSLTGLGFLYTFSVLSHASTMRGLPATVADLIHLAAATVWVSAVLFSVLHKNWTTTGFEITIKRVSSLALVCVALLVGTGIYTTLTHLETWTLLFSTKYGRVLLLKLGVFSLVLVLAALNRWYFMPRLLERSTLFHYALLAESLLLILVLLITGLLTVSPLPHEM